MQIEEQLKSKINEGKTLSHNLKRVENLHTIINTRLSVINKSIKVISEALILFEGNNPYDDLDSIIGYLKHSVSDYRGEIEQIKTDDEIGQVLRLTGHREDILEATIGVNFR